MVADWLSRDPIGEKGGLNLYGFTKNDPIGVIDALGLADLRFQIIKGRFDASSIVGLSGTWSQPWWAGSGSDSVTANSASTTVNIENSPLLGFISPAIYCNTVSFDDSNRAGDAGSIWVFLKDQCGGKFKVTFNYQVHLWGNIDAGTVLLLEGPPPQSPVIDRGVPHQFFSSYDYSTDFTKAITVTLKAGEEKHILTYDPQLGLRPTPSGLWVSATGTIKDVKVELQK